MKLEGLTPREQKRAAAVNVLAARTKKQGEKIAALEEKVLMMEIMLEMQGITLEEV